MTSCSGWPTAECFITSANIPRGHLGAGGARERNDSDTLPGGEESGLGEDPMVEGKENAVRKESKLCLLASFVFILLFNLILNFK